MKVNVNEFRNFVQKATLNYTIDSININYDKENDKVWSKMISTTSDAVSILNVGNSIFTNVKDDVELNFCNPKTELKPYLDLIDDEEVEFKLHKNKIVLDKKVKIHFDDPSVVSTFGGNAPSDNIEYFVTLNVDEQFFNEFKKIKKIGNRFGKVYFTVTDNKLYLETMDKTNTYSNGISFELCDVDTNDLSMCFDYNLFCNLMNVVDDENFKIKLTYMEEREGGMVYLYNLDESEQYFLMSKIE